MLCVCRGGQVRSVATRFLLNDLFGFRKVICAGWEKNDPVTLREMCDWAQVVIVVGRPNMWNLNTPVHKTINIEIGPDVYGHYQHPRLLELLVPKLTEIVEPVPVEQVA